MGPLGVPEIIFIFVLALLIFGPKKLPQLGKTFGKSMAEFRRASDDLRSTFKREMDSIERETEEVKAVTQEVKKDLDTTSYYDDGEDDYYTDYDGTTNEAKSSSNPSSASAGPGTGKASTNGNDAKASAASKDAKASAASKDAKASAASKDAKASAASNDGTPPDEVPSTVEKSTEAAEV